MASKDLDSVFSSIPLPTPANFPTWQSKLRLALANANCWATVMAKDPNSGARPTRPTPYDANNITPAEREAMQRYDAALAKSVAIIAHAAGDNYLEMTVPFLNRSDPGGLWDELERRLAQRTGSSRFNAITQFFTTSRTAGELWADLASRIAAHRSRIQSLFPTGFTLIDFLNELETFQFLRAFPEDSVVRSTIIAQGNLDPAHVRDMVEMLITAPAHTAPDRANLVGFTPSKFPPCPWCSGTNHASDNCFSYNDYHTLYLKEKAQGIRCGSDGNIIASGGSGGRGGYNRRGRGRGGPQRGGHSQQAQEQTQVAEGPTETAGIASSFTSLTDPHADLWTSDSGASRHMTPRIEWIQSLMPDRRPIKVADGRCVYSAGIGSIVLYPVKAGVPARPFRINDVLYVPDLNANLISTNQLSQSQGFRITTVGKTTKYIRGRKVLFSATAHPNNLSYLDVETHTPETAAHSFAQAVPATPQRWHQRWAHAGPDLLKELRTSDAIKGFSIKKGPEVDDICEPCIEGRMHRAPHTKAAERATEPLALVSTDVKGPMEVRSREGNQYWIVFMCSFSGMAAVYFMREKGEGTEKFKLYKAWAENQLGRKIKRLRDDKGGEYRSHELLSFTNQSGIDRERTIRDTPEQNGQAERFNLTLSEGITSMLSQAQLPPSMWQDAAATYVHMYNRKPSKARGMRSPYELWYGRVPSVGHFRVWGCLAFVHLQKDQRSQFGPHAKKCVFIRYAHDSKGWVFWDTERKREIVSDSAVFDEDFFPGTLTGKIIRRIALPSSDEPVIIDDAEPAPAPAPVTPQEPSDAEIEGGTNTPPRNDSPAPAPATPPRDETPAPAPGPLVIRIPGAIQRAENQRLAERQRLDSLPREVRGLMDNFSSRHNDGDLPPRRGNRPPPLERGLGVEDDGEEDDVEVNIVAGVADMVTPGLTPPIQNDSAIRPMSIPRSSWFKPNPPSFYSDSISIPLLNAIDFALSTSASTEPKSLKEALSLPDSEKWVAAAIDEINAHLENKTWELCRLPAGKKAIGSRWVFKVKHNADGSVERYKGRIVAKGYAQRQGVDYTDTFAPTARFAALRSVIALAAIEDLELESIDISTAFLNGEIDAEVYMEVPEGVEVNHEQDGHKWVLRLLKGLYGIKQGPRIWAKKLHKELVSMGFQRLECDHSVFVYMRDNVRIVVPVHVDDLLLASNSKEALTQFKLDLGKRFKIRDLGPVKQILGIHLERDRANRTISLSQTHYIEEMIEEVVGNGPFNGVHTPIDDIKSLSAFGPHTKEQVSALEKVDYRGLVGKLLYLSIATRPDISYAVGVLCRYNDRAGPKHWEAAKRVLRYLKETKLLKLVYSPSHSDDPFVVYSDADLGGDPSTSRSTAGYVTKIGTGAVSWGSRLHRHTSLSSTEAEYTTASAAGTELMWMRYFLEECGYELPRPSKLLMDNASAIQVAKNPEHQSTMKHVHREYHWIRENVEKGLIHVAHVPSAENIADIFTKALKRPSFTRLRELLGLRF
jgi:Reverse transcriptase (RNA-dependent DNA polymerase)/GAG-pre-integrase domain